VRTGPFANAARNQFLIGHRFRRAGRHVVDVALLGGTCRGDAEVLARTRRSIQVAAAGARSSATSQSGAIARVAQARGGCADADLRVTSRNRRRIERAVRCLLAEERLAAGLSRLRPSAKLSVAARRHVADMQRRRYIAHAHPRGPALSGRLRAVRYSGAAGETISVGSGRLATPRGTVRGWMNSAPHRTVILTGRYRKVGVGVRQKAPVLRGSGAATYTAVFGV
jgi:uncharacterized protein YkwD